LILKNGQSFLLFAVKFTKLPKSDVFPKIFVKITQKIQILLDIFNKSALRIILSARLHAVVCGNKTGRETKNALYLNEILHGKPRGFPIVRGRVLCKQNLMSIYTERDRGLAAFAKEWSK